MFISLVVLKVIDRSGANSRKFSSFQEFKNGVKVGSKILVTKFVFELLDIVKFTRFKAD